MAPSIKEFYANKSVFITGASGFIGLVLVEKLLRSCSDVKCLYVLMRPKKGRSQQERLEKLLDNPLFDRLRDEKPGIIDEKLVLVPGDVTKERLGMSDEDYQMVADNTNIIFHSAASVKFDDSLQYAFKINVDGTKELVDLALKMRNLKSLIHISTTYSNCDFDVIEERIYPEPADWRKTKDILETTDTAVMNILTEKYLWMHPNTYVFTKALAERVMYDYKDELPVAIVRPAVVIGTYKEPYPGWVCNLNGPVALFLGLGKGIVRSSLVDPDVVVAYVPADLVIKTLIISAWKRGTTAPPEGEMPVYNICSLDHSISIRKLTEIADKVALDNPIQGALWWHSTHITKYPWVYYINVLFKQVLPAILVDFYLKFKGQKPMLVELQKKIITAGVALQHFTLKYWEISSAKCLEMVQNIPEKDKAEFEIDLNVDPTECFRNLCKEAKRLLLKEPDDPASREKNLARARKLYWLDKAVVTTWRVLIMILLYNVFLQFYDRLVAES